MESSSKPVEDLPSHEQYVLYLLQHACKTCKPCSIERNGRWPCLDRTNSDPYKGVVPRQGFFDKVAKSLLDRCDASDCAGIRIQFRQVPAADHGYREFVCSVVVNDDCIELCASAVDGQGPFGSEGGASDG